jgi:uncharacterized membrane protein
MGRETRAAVGVDGFTQSISDRADVRSQPLEEACGMAPPIGQTSNASEPGNRLAPVKLQPSPVLVQHAEERAQSVQNRIADRITAFAGSMRFVYLHIVWFASWIVFRVEHYPYGLLTMVVSLEAIFLSTFVMISQNRADAKRQVVADHQWTTVQEEDKQNRELLDLSHQILELTRAVHANMAARPDTSPVAQPSHAD